MPPRDEPTPLTIDLLGGEGSEPSDPRTVDWAVGHLTRRRWP